MPDLKTIIGWVVVAALSLLVSRAFRGTDRRNQAETDEREANRKKVSELERQVAVLIAEAVPINAMVQAIAIAKLTHMHEPATDKLLAKSADDNLSRKEVDQLETALNERMVVVDSEVDEEERIYAKILPDIIRLRQIEEEKLKAGQQPPMGVVKVIAPVLENK